MYYNTVDDTVYVYDGASWLDLAAGGGGSGDITAVVAGDGLTGGATTGSATLNVGAGTGITVNADTIEVNTSVIATKEYVDGVAQGLDIKASCRLATTVADGNIGLSGLSNIDGVTPLAGDRILVKNQTTGSENGIYVADASSWSRASDAAQSGEITPGTFVFVEQGATHADSGWVVTTNGTITIGATDIVWTQFSGAGQIDAGIALTKTGNTLDVDLTDATNSTSTTTAATPNSVKQAYDLANAAIPKSTATTEGDIIYATGNAAVTRLGRGSNGQVLTLASGIPSWADIGGAWTSYTPTMGGGFTIGNGTQVSKYVQSGKIVFGKIDITTGSTTNIGNQMTATLPVAPVGMVAGTGVVKRYTRAYPIYVHYNSFASPVNISLAVDSDGQTYVYTDIATEIPTYEDLDSLGTYVFANSIPDVVPIRSARPISFAADDIIEVSFWYEVA